MRLAPDLRARVIHLGVEMGAVATKATLADALKLSFQKLGLVVIKAQ